MSRLLSLSRSLPRAVRLTQCAPLSRRCYSVEPIPAPNVEGQPCHYPEKIRDLVTEIGKLTLIEVADLNELLKQELKIKDVPMMMGASMMAAAAPPAEEEEVEVKREKTSFTVKLVKFDESKKIALIKEIKNLLPGTNLVQAKKFVESLPQPVQTDIGKDEAEKLKATLAAVGGEVEIE